MKILAVETSCDETAAAVVQDGTKILGSAVSSSLTLHAKTGGIIPEAAAREQGKAMIPILKSALSEANLSEKNIDALAVTYGPGLFGCLLVGVETVKTLGYVWNKPIVPVNHLIGHLYAAWLKNESPPKFPLIALVVSGGHTELILATDHKKYNHLGGTRDDAAGEAFDKVARLLGLGYPGGPSIEKAAQSGDPSKFDLPRPLAASSDFDFSFSGLKTASLNLITNKKLAAGFVNDAAASFQEAVVDSLVGKTIKATKKYGVGTLVLGGGVAANKRLGEKMKEKFQGGLYISLPELSVDNGAMIGAAAFFNYHPASWNEISTDASILL